MLVFGIIGDAFVDVVAGTLESDQLPKWGRDVVCSRPIELQPGGSALNTATHIANLGHGHRTREVKVDLHTAIGSDSFGEVVKTHLASRHVALYSPILDGVPTGVCVVLSGTEDRSFLTHYGAARVFSIEHIDEVRLLSAHHLHIGGFYSCSNLQGRLKPLLIQARTKGLTISLDTNYDGTEQWDELDQLYPLLDVFMPNEVEAMHASHTTSIEEAMAYFASRIAGITVIKVGAGGARAYCSKTQTHFTQNSYKATVVDVTGAGDAFNAGFLTSWKSNGDIQTALQWGCATASRCVSTLGACQVPIEYKDVEQLIATEERVEKE